MIVGVSVISCSLLYSIILAIVFFNKGKINTFETKLYGFLLILNIVGLLLELCCCFSVYHIEYFGVVNELFNRIYLMYYVTFITTFTIYIYYVTNESTKSNNVNILNTKKNKTFFGTLYLIGYLLVLFLPLYYHSKNAQVYSYGPAVDALSCFCVIYMLFDIYCIVKNIKNVRGRKLVPLFTLVICFILAFIIRNINPAIILITSSFAVVTMIMFFTIENPDMKLLEEVHKSKEISDNANEEKTMFLYNISQEIRNSTDIVDDYANLILESDDSEEIKDSARNIKAETSKFNSLMNEIFDVSKLDSSNIKVYNNKYNVKNILKEIVSIYTKKCEAKSLSFRVNIDHDIPELLYGDSINLKKALMIILDNSLEYTNDGYVEFNVNTIIKNDVCRLLISIEDSGKGIKGEEINKLKLNDKSFSEANKLITLMSGAINVSSNYGYGTKVKIILDQKIEIEHNEDVAKYEELYDSVKLLMVDDSEAGIKIVDKIIRGTNINMEFAMNGKDCMSKLKTEHYDLILLDEQLTQISAVELMKKITGIKNFNTPVILLTKDNSYEYSEEYKKLGFSDYLLKPVKKKELLDKVNDYMKKDK